MVGITVFSWVCSGEVLPHNSVQDPNQAFPARLPCQEQDCENSNSNADLRGMGQREATGRSLINEVKNFSLSFPILLLAARKNFSCLSPPGVMAVSRMHFIRGKLCNLVTLGAVRGAGGELNTIRNISL